MNIQESVIAAAAAHSPKHAQKFRSAIIDTGSHDVHVLANVCAYVCSENHINCDMPNPFPAGTDQHLDWAALMEPVIAKDDERAEAEFEKQKAAAEKRAAEEEPEPDAEESEEDADEPDADPPTPDDSPDDDENTDDGEATPPAA